MKISPVTGTPSVQQTTMTGLSPEKLVRLKAIAEGRTEETPTPEPEVVVQPPGEGGPLPTNKAEETPEASTETVTSDAIVQTNDGSEATKPLSPQLAALAKQRRALQVKEREIADKEKSLERLLNLETRIKTQPLSVLQELGVTYDQLTQEILAQQNGTSEIQVLKDEIKSMREGIDKTLSDRDAAQERAVLTEMSRNIDKLSQDDDFELIRKTKSQEDVLQRIYDRWKTKGEIIDELEAMREVEEELVNDYLTLAKSKKMQGKLTPPTASLQSQPQQGMKTLTNKDQAAPSLSRRQRAINAMLGQKG